MAGPAAAAGAQAAKTAAGRAAGKAAGNAATRSGSEKAAKGAASRSAKGKGGGGSSNRTKLIGHFSSFRGRKRKPGGEEPVLFTSSYITFVGIAGGAMLFFLLVIIAPLLIFDAAANSCGGAEEDEAVPIQTNHKTDPENLSQTQIAIRIYLVGQVMGMTARQVVTAYDVAYVESTMTNIYGGDSDSRGVFQQRNFSPWTDGGKNRNNVIDASIAFFLQLRKLDEGQPIPVLAQDVQVSAYPERYYEWVDDGVAMYNKIHNLLGSANGVKKIESLQGVVINGSGLDALTLGAACSGITAMGPANVKEAVTLYGPRSYKTLPANLWIGGGEPQQVDTRIWEDAVWVLSTFHLKATAARETGHKTHGDGTAMDMVPANGDSPEDWDSSALALARALGWDSDCGSNGLAKSAGGTCDLVPAVIFIGYNGFESHGDPSHCSRIRGCPPHIHVSWYSSCYGCGGGALVSPRDWVKVFPAGEEEEEKEKKPKPGQKPSQGGGSQGSKKPGRGSKQKAKAT